MPDRFHAKLEAGMPLAVLPEIGGRALIAVIGRGPVVIGKRAWDVTGAVIVPVADVVGQRVPLHIAVIADIAGVVPSVMVVARIRHARRQDCR